MALFLIVALGNAADAVDGAVASAVPSDSAYKIESGKWVVASDVATAKDVSDKLAYERSYAYNHSNQRVFWAGPT